MQLLCRLRGTILVLAIFQSPTIIQSIEQQLGVCNYGRIEESGVSENDTSKVVYLLTMFPYPQEAERSKPTWDEGPSVLPAAQLAVDHINQDPHILPDHTLRLINTDGGCNVSTIAVINLVKHIFGDGIPRDEAKKPIIGIIGPSCSESAIAVSSIIGRGKMQLPNVHISLSAELEDRDEYPYTFGVIGSTFQIVGALFSLIHYNGWNKVAILFDDSRASFQATKRLRETILNQSFVAFYSAVYDTFFPLESLKKSGAKIIAITTTLPFAQKIMCIAKNEGMLFPDYQWIIVGHSHEEFTQNTRFRYRGQWYECDWTDPNSGRIMLEKQLFIHFRLRTKDTNLPLVSGRTLQQVTRSYYRYVYTHNANRVCPFDVVPNIWASTVYDAVWALLLSLNTTITSIVDATDGSFKDQRKVDEIKDNFQHVLFNGMSGRIEFDISIGFAQRLVEIDQINNSTAVLVGTITTGGNVSFSDRIILIELPEPRYLYETVNYFLAAVFVLIEVVLLLATAALHVVTILNKKYPSVKASSAGLNQFFFLGCYLLGVASIVYIVIMKALALPNDIVASACHVLLVWLVPIAITLSFGILIAKTWRIYRIFVHFRKPGPLISNKALIMIVLLQLSIDVIIGTAWSIVSPITLTVLEERSYMNEEGETILPRQCVFTNTEYWMIILSGYKSLQMTSLLVLCLLTRSIRNRRFSTTSLSRASYFGLLLITTLFPLYVILWWTNATVDVDFAVLCVFFSGNGLVFLIFVLVPPVLPLLRKISVTLCAS